MDISKPIDDPHSFAKPEHARVNDIHLELSVDFDRRVLKGKATLTIERKSDIKYIFLDNYRLVISRVTNIDGTHLDYYIATHQIYGSSFCIELSIIDNIIDNFERICKIQIEYETSPDSPALYWLTPEQTADGTHFFLLSNTKLTYARAIFPCQDTPSVKFTYTAEISVPKSFTVLMSALFQESSICDNSELVTYKFQQIKLVPSYAVIIAVGSLVRRQLNKQSDIFAEKTFIDESFDTFHFGLVEGMLQIAERLYGPYVWDNRYDICVLPPSIAHFEIECPCITFISPSLLYGDCSYISTLALNISQSWAGNLITCSNYEHLWLNKSFSIFISRKIKCKIFIREEIKCFFQREGPNNLCYMLEKFGNTGSLKCLLPKLSCLLPHKVTKYIPYERGYMLLDHLENILGGSLVFESFLRCYFNEFAYKSINTKDWINYLYRYFSDKKEILDRVAWKGNFYNIATPVNLPQMTVWETKYFELAKKWVNWDCNTPFNLIDEEKGKPLHDIQKIMFLNYLHFFHTALTKEKLKTISFCYFSEIYNYHIRFIWLLLCIKIRWKAKVEPVLDFVTEFCSPNYACPIFQHLYEWTEMRPIAIKMYIKNKEKMLYETQKKLDEILHLN